MARWTSGRTKKKNSLEKKARPDRRTAGGKIQNGGLTRWKTEVGAPKNGITHAPQNFRHDCWRKWKCWKKTGGTRGETRKKNWERLANVNVKLEALDWREISSAGVCLSSLSLCLWGKRKLPGKKAGWMYFRGGVIFTNNSDWIMPQWLSNTEKFISVQCCIMRF